MPYAVRRPGRWEDCVTASSPATDTPPASYGDLRALVINCTLKPSPEPSNTQGLIDRSTAVMSGQGVHVDVVRAADHDIATGVWPDMREHGWRTDAWPDLYRQVTAADIYSRQRGSCCRSTPSATCHSGVR